MPQEGEKAEKCKMKKIVSEIKNSLDGLKSKMELAEKQSVNLKIINGNHPI